MKKIKITQISAVNVPEEVDVAVFGIEESTGDVYTWSVVTCEWCLYRN